MTTDAKARGISLDVPRIMAGLLGFALDTVARFSHSKKPKRRRSLTKPTPTPEDLEREDFAAYNLFSRPE